MSSTALHKKRRSGSLVNKTNRNERCKCDLRPQSVLSSTAHLRVAQFIAGWWLSKTSPHNVVRRWPSAMQRGAAFSLQVDEPDWQYHALRKECRGRRRPTTKHTNLPACGASKGRISGGAGGASSPSGAQGGAGADRPGAIERGASYATAVRATSVRCWRRTARIGRVGTYAVEGVGRCAGGAAFNAAVNEKGPAMPGLSSGGGSHQPLRPPWRPGADHPLPAAAGGVIRR